MPRPKQQRLPAFAEAITQPAPRPDNLTDDTRPQRYRVQFNKPLPLIVPHQGIGRLDNASIEWADAGIWVLPPDAAKRTFVPFADVLMIVEL